MLGDIKMKSLLFEGDDIIIWYNLEVGNNSHAICSITIPDHIYKKLDTEKKLFYYIKKGKIMPFKEALKKYWKANPWLQVTVYFSLLFTGLTLWAGGAPLVFWAIIVAVYLTLGIGSFYNIKKIQERDNNKL